MKPNKLKPGDKIAIVSLSSGILGEDFYSHQLEIGTKRLKQFGLEPVFMNSTLKGSKYIKEHPEQRAKDLKDAFKNSEIKAILCAIGGEDTYKTILFLLDDKDFIESVKKNPKIFIGFSDSTNNHLMFNKLGLNTFYGHSFLSDFAELDQEMLIYSKKAFEVLFSSENNIDIKSSAEWFEERKDFSIKSLNTSRLKHIEENGYDFLNDKNTIVGKLFGGCLESLYDGLTGKRYADQKDIWKKYNIFPKTESLKETIFFIETSEESASPKDFERMIMCLEKEKIFKYIKALIVGKPQDNNFYFEYKNILNKISEKYNLPIVLNMNFGHSYPRTIIPYNCLMKIDFEKDNISIIENIVN
ncbi:S66 family peptidase [Spiroplasma floricola]|uniref:LD-carboxypeptidase n=1 Tax=Spiroplasma floricola 23-6 TaxID=1336749 RepID=A0A2K8SDA9_9MOLU|nr:S66 peptidase family protein [Spiroplasma floricola]AUB31208.1 LD-carboxypeptidase [Spiroplasma floricola 23-6]